MLRLSAHGCALRADGDYNRIPWRTSRPHRPRLDGDWPRTGPSRHSFHSQKAREGRSEEHTSELQSLMRISYAVFCLKKKRDAHDYEKDEIATKFTYAK